MFDGFLAERDGPGYVPFDPVKDYDTYVDGKPPPDTFRYAAQRLGLDSTDSAVFEDALAGVEAGRAGGFGYVVGVDRSGEADALRAHGADIVVEDLAELLDQS